MTPKFLAYIVILCFEKRRPKQNSPYFTSLAIYQVMLNANEISGKAANKFKLTHFLIVFVSLFWFHQFLNVWN